LDAGFVFETKTEAIGFHNETFVRPKRPLEIKANLQSDLKIKKFSVKPKKSIQAIKSEAILTEFKSDEVKMKQTILELQKELT
jgi:hypothetical protein